MPLSEARKEYMRKYAADYMPRMYAQKRAELINRMGGKCELCGSCEKLYLFKRDPEKSADLDLSRFWQATEEVQLQRKPELILLCRLHKPNPRQTKTGHMTHGTWFAAMKKKCRCETCCAFLVKYNADRRQSRRVARLEAGLPVRLPRNRDRVKPIQPAKPRISRPKIEKPQADIEMVELVQDKKIDNPTNAPHGSWHMAINKGCKCKICLAFLKGV